MKLKFGIILKNMRKSILILACLLSIVAAQACMRNNSPSQEVWEYPATEVNTEIEGYFRTLLEITRVEFAKDDTRIMMRVALRPEEWVKFTSDTYLLADGKRYALKRCDGMELDKEVYLTENGQANLVFHFEPLPKKTKRFDFIEGDGPGAFRILGIESAATRAEQLFPSNWRNTQTGEWEIGFYEDFAIYDCRFWNYKERLQKGDKYTIVLENEGKEIRVNVDKCKNGKRQLTIDGSEGEYNIITSITLPDYPTKDTRTSFKDTHYQTDTVTFIGWLKDMPEGMKKKGNEYKVNHYDIFIYGMNAIISNYGKMDSLGRFVIKIPLRNSSEVFFDWDRTFIRTLFEPGETYFMLYDYKAGHKLFMGTDCRLQNETLAFPIGWLNRSYGRDMDKEAAMNYLESMKKHKEHLMGELEKVKAAHPTLSDRYVNYLTGLYNTEEGRELMQARYVMKDRSCPEEYLSYVTRQHWQQRKQPYTLYREFSTFLQDFTSELVANRYSIKSPKGYVTPKDKEPLLRRCREEGRINISDEELAIAERIDKEDRKIIDIMLNDGDEAYIKAIEEPKWKEINAQFTPIAEREDIKKVLKEEAQLVGIYNTLNIVDSLGCDKELRDIIITRELLRIIDGERKPLNEYTMQFLEKNVSMAEAKALVQAEHEKYLALERRDISKSPSLKSAEDVANLSDGEKILRKIIEPYKGKIILLDIWGTWCGPCKAALAESQKEYERLKKYDIIFLYLANNSSDASWKNVIKMYNVEGENVVHYNLPKAQQSAIENFLGVNAFPTYKLIDRNGNVLDVNADPRDLEGLVRLLEKMK